LFKVDKKLRVLFTWWNQGMPEAKSSRLEKLVYLRIDIGIVTFEQRTNYHLDIAYKLQVN